MSEFADRPEIETADIDALAPELLADDLERAAIALWNMKFKTPEDVGVQLARDDQALVQAWCGGPGVTPADRNLYRRRAAMVLEAARRDDFGLSEG